MNGTAPRQVTGRGDLVVVLSCRWCHQEIQLVAGELGPEIVDAAAFLAVHRDCLTRGGFPAQHSEGQD